MKCNISPHHTYDDIQNDYERLLSHTYITDEETINSIGEIMTKALTVGNNIESKLYYISVLEIHNITICAPLTLEDLKMFGKTFEQFERDYIPKLYTNKNFDIIYEEF